MSGRLSRYLAIMFAPGICMMTGLSLTFPALFRGDKGHARLVEWAPALANAAFVFAAVVAVTAVIGGALAWRNAKVAR